MRRRVFLGIAGAAVARLSFADTAIKWEQVRRPGVRNLVLVIPEGDSAKYDRGRAFGEWIEHGTPAQLARLSTCSVSCASMSDLRKLVKGLPAGEPWMVLIDSDGSFDTLDGNVPKDQPMAALSSMLERSRKLPRAPIAAGEVMRKQLVATPPPGSHWATDSMCGFEHVEGMTASEDNQVSIDCGMGAIPERSARFLYFWTRTPAQRYFDRQGRKT